MGDNNLKQISLTGGAIDDYNRMKVGGRKRKGGRTRKQKNEDFEEEIPINQMKKEMVFTKVGGGTEDQTTNRQPPVQLPIISTPANTSVGHVAKNPEALITLPAINAQMKATTQSGGKKKIILTPKKHKSNLLLAPPTNKKTDIKVVNKTRKIKVQLSNMKKRVTTAKIIHKNSKEKSIEEIRKLLEEAKLVKPAKEGKKVPEDILRNIYKDYLILRNKAL